jgi:DNA-directed RNA polymerase specialized sigma24 family protein
MLSADWSAERKEVEWREAAAEGALDPVLGPFVQCAEADAADLLGRLLTEQVRPVIQGVLRRGAGDGRAEPETSDLEGEVLALLVERLRRLRLERGAPPVRDLRAYTAAVTFHVVSDHRRRQRLEGRRMAGSDGGVHELADAQPDAAAAFERRTYLHRLWQEITALPPRQAAALLLNLRDAKGANAVSLLPLTGVASLRDVARILGMPAEELAALWSRLPLDDATIAVTLGLSRQQVINLRKSARQRLARRMRAR